MGGPAGQPENYGTHKIWLKCHWSLENSGDCVSIASASSGVRVSLAFSYLCTQMSLSRSVKATTEVSLSNPVPNAVCQPKKAVTN